MLYRDLVKNKTVDLDPERIRYGQPIYSGKIAWGLTRPEQRPGDVPYYRPKPDSRWGREVVAVPASYPDLRAGEIHCYARPDLLDLLARLTEAVEVAADEYDLAFGEGSGNLTEEARAVLARHAAASRGCQSWASPPEREPAEIRVRRFDPAPGVPSEAAFEAACNELAAQGFTLQTWNFIRIPGEPYDGTIFAVFEKPARGKREVTHGE